MSPAAAIIDSFAAVTSFTTTLSTGEEAIEGTRTVVARFKTLGTALADDSVLLSVGGTAICGFLLSVVV